MEEITKKSKLDIIKFLDDKNVENLFSQLKINPNKWIRLRQNNNKSVLTLKHILEKNTSNFQNALEIEFEVSSLDEANLVRCLKGNTSEIFYQKLGGKLIDFETNKVGSKNIIEDVYLFNI